MAYEIPQQLEYKEKIIFGLTFKQVFYLFIFAPIVAIIFFKSGLNFFIRLFLSLNLSALGAGFIFLNLEYHLKNWIRWGRSRIIETPKEIKKPEKKKIMEEIRSILIKLSSPSAIIKKIKSILIKLTSSSIRKFIPIKEIKDNLIIRNDGKKIAVLKIEPVNFSIKPEESKEVITAMFQENSI